MASFLSTLFLNNDDYLVEYMENLNKNASFPLKKEIKYARLVNGLRNDSVLISGGTDEERTAVLLGLIKSLEGKIVVVHNGNSFLKADRIRGYGVRAEEWDTDIYKGLDKTQILSLLSGTENEDGMLFFYAYALEVCEVLNLPVSIEGIACIDWADISWQKKLAMKMENGDHAQDLLRRFDRNMAERAVAGMGIIERLTRSRANGTGIKEFFENDILLTKEIYGSNNLAARHCMEIVEALAESGVKFTLILDDVYLPDCTVIREKYRNMRLILAAEDIYQLGEQKSITKRACNVIVFKHPEYESAEAISKKYFGTYTKLSSEMSKGKTEGFLVKTTYNTGVAVKKEEVLRVYPKTIVALPEKVAIVHLTNGEEGVLYLN